SSLVKFAPISRFRDAIYLCREVAIKQSNRRISAYLFVVCDPAALTPNARLNSLFWNRFGCTGFRQLVLNRDDASFRDVLNGFVCSLSYWVVLERQGTDINVQ